MVPIKKKDKPYLQCTKCGYTTKADKDKDKEKYTLKEKIDKKNKVKTTSLVAKPSTFQVSEEEKQQRLEEYYEVALELIQEEFEGTESED